MDAPTFTLPPVPARVRRVLLFVAMRGEAAPIAQALGATGGRARVGAAEVEILVPGVDPVLGVDRLGPVHAAAALARAFAAGRPDLVVNMGTCGGFEAHGQRIADLVVVRDTLFPSARAEVKTKPAVYFPHQQAHGTAAPHQPQCCVPDAPAAAVATPAAAAVACPP
jgi:hypothetical protein